MFPCDINRLKRFCAQLKICICQKVKPPSDIFSYFCICNISGFIDDHKLIINVIQLDDKRYCSKTTEGHKDKVKCVNFE